MEASRRWGAPGAATNIKIGAGPEVNNRVLPAPRAAYRVVITIAPDIGSLPTSRSTVAARTAS